jgi:AcrR family transcriptional regulator
LTKQIGFDSQLNRALDLNVKRNKLMVRLTKSLNAHHQDQHLIDDLITTPSKNAHLIEIKRQQIADGACQLFFEKGYHPTTTRDIAQACGMSMGQLYHYISSKDDVLYLVHKRMQGIWYEYLKNTDYEETKDPVQKLIRALHQTVKFATENRKLIQFLYSESKYLSEKHLQAVLEMDKQIVINFWRQLLEELNKKRPIKADLDFTASLIAYTNVFLALRGWTLRDKPTKESIASLIDFILKGLGVMQ